MQVPCDPVQGVAAYARYAQWAGGGCAVHTEYRLSLCTAFCWPGKNVLLSSGAWMPECFKTWMSGGRGLDEHGLPRHFGHFLLLPLS